MTDDNQASDPPDPTAVGLYMLMKDELVLASNRDAGRWREVLRKLKS